MVEIKELNREEYSGKNFTVKYQTKGYFDIQSTAEGFDISYKLFSKPKEMSFSDVFFNEWLGNPVGFGAFEDLSLIHI